MERKEVEYKRKKQNQPKGGRKFIRLIALVLVFVSCAGTEANSLSDYTDGIQAYEEVRNCLNLTNMPSTDEISVIESEQENLPCGTRACSSDRLEIYIVPSLMNVRVWKHELAHILRLWYYGNIDPLHESAWFDDNGIFICNKGF